MSTLLTIGHSQLALESFLSLLAGAGVTAVADVRSVPVSRRHPWFSRDALAPSLKEAGLGYVFLGDSLGGRPRDPRLMTAGVADYERMAREPAFTQGLGRIIRGVRTHRIALMCSEADPLDCHRCLLVGRALAGAGLRCEHILPSGDRLEQSSVEERLLELARLDDEDLFSSREERLAAAYRRRGMRIAFASSEAA